MEKVNKNEGAYMWKASAIRIDSRRYYHTRFVREGVRFFFNKVDGYHRGMCVKFYKNMKVNVSGTIKSRFQGKTIMIIDDTIASYLHYVRPNQDQIQHPMEITPP